MRTSNKSQILKKSFLCIALGYLSGNLVAYIHTYNTPIIAQLYLVATINKMDVPQTMLIGYGLFIVGLIAPLFFLGKKQEKYGYAKIAKSKDIADPKKHNLYAKEGIIFGKAYNKTLRLKESLSVLVSAPPGTGKTTGMILPNVLLNKENSLVIHDPKGEILKTTALYRSKFSKISVFDPVSDSSSSFNALDNALLSINDDGSVNLSKSRTHIENIATVLLPVPKGTGDTYWITAARSMFVYIAMWVLWKDQKVSIPAVRELLLSQQDAEAMFKSMQRGVDPRAEKDITQSEPSDDDILRYNQLKKSAEMSKRGLPKIELEELQTLDKLINGVRDQKGDYEVPQMIIRDGNGVLSTAKNEKQLAGVMGTLQEQLAVFADDTISKNTREGCDFTSEKLRKELTTLYVVVRDVDKDRIKTLTAMLFEVLAKQSTIKMPDPEERTITFFLDEFVRLGQLNAIASLPDVGRGYRANVVYICQEFSQIKAVYEKDTADAINSNCSVKVVYRQNSFETAKNISDLIGNRTVERKSESADKTKTLGGKKSESTSEEGIPLFSPQDILNLRKNKCIVLVQGEMARPIYADIFYWFNDKNLKKIIAEYGFDIGEDIETVYTALQLKKEAS